MAIIVRRAARSLVLVALAVAAGAAATPVRQPGALLVRVLDAATNQPVVNADVHDQGSGARRLTDVRGEVRFAVSNRGSLRLRIRQLGFQPVERTVAIWPETLGEPLVVHLSHVVRLAATTSQASNACRGTPDSLPSPLSLRALEQLRFGAEQYERFREQYPFQLVLKRRKSYLSPTGAPLTTLDFREELQQRGAAYEPRGVVSGDGLLARVSPLLVETLADPVFWDHHCLVARRAVTVNGRRLLPLEFLPAIGQRAPDWGGTAWLDSATSELRRVDFQLVGLRDTMQLGRMEGYITFTYPSPHIAQPDSLVSLWWLRAPGEGRRWGPPTLVEVLRVDKVRYLGETPPAQE